MTLEGRRIAVHGVVQGVGFRPWVYRVARAGGISGRVSNDAAGVTIDAFGPAIALDAFVKSLSASPPPAAQIRNLAWESIPAEKVSEFVIVESRKAGELRAASRAA